MIKNPYLDDRFDGWFYGPDDMVNVGCADCEGCSDCCRDSADTIILDPYDMYNLTRATGKTFTDMIEKEIEIRMVDGLILPNLMLTDEANVLKLGKCPFLNEKDMCSIHPYRPGFCRLFPLARIYDGDDFNYVLWKNECSKAAGERYPVKLRDWLGIENLKEYEDFIRMWHGLCREMRGRMEHLPDEQKVQAARYILQVFYVTPYLGEVDFYRQFAARIEKFK